MRTVFIVNPKAGKGKDIDGLIDKINSAFESLGKESDIYMTRGVGDATRYVKEQLNIDKNIRFIACGGDGTLNEVINGVAGVDTAEAGVVPIGTGNDFCRNFGNDCDFNNLELQIAGGSERCDVIEYTTHTQSGVKKGYCINMFNIGFDCNVADMCAEFKKKPLISGSMAYFISILVNLIKKKGADLDVVVDGKRVHSDSVLLTSVANGSYCGGGIMSNPYASIEDGKINMNIINDVSRLKFISLLPSYMKGTHFARKGIDKIIKTFDCEKITITPNTDRFRFSVDGEIMDAGKTEFSLLVGGVRFVRPKPL